MKPLRFVFKILLAQLIVLFNLSLSIIFTTPQPDWLAWGLGLQPFVPVVDLGVQTLSTYFGFVHCCLTIGGICLPSLKLLFIFQCLQTPEVGLLGVLNDFVPHTHACILIQLLLFHACKYNSAALEKCCLTFHPTVLHFS